MRGHEIHLAITVVAIVLILLRRRIPLTTARKVVLIAAVIVLGFLRHDLPSIHCIAEGFFSRLTLEFLKLPMVYKLAIAFLPALFFGRVFCGYVCPKGAAQELIFIRKLRLKIPKRVDSALRLVPYLSLGALIVFPVWFQYRLWTDLDPFLWLFHFHGHIPGLILLAVVLVSSVVLFRPFCRYLCPMVPIFRLMSRLAPSKRTADRATCRGCKSGMKACDYDVITLAIPPPLPDAESDGEQKKPKPACQFHAQECLQCGRCQKRCPRDAIS